ncbi:APC family permease [Mycobacterium hackensackense]|jgi:amino acid transporter|uniref:APC family permease n=1 Tax=Mycobacterium hackensackense TaxID=228909 RepID=UPI002265E3F8|nr:APC family permease [Mycobacterium hackensackense]MCV7254317.1 APC family permease [Mycobacterium hackensackense]
MAQPAPPAQSLNSNSIGLVPGVFQALTHMGPAAGVASSLLVAVAFAGPATPLAVLLALIVILLVGVAIGSLARVFSSAGGLADYVEQCLGKRAGAFVGWLYAPLELLIAPIVLVFFGQFLSGTINAAAGVDIPWWVFVIPAALLVCLLNIRGVQQSTATGVVMGAAEIGTFLVLAVWMIVAGGHHNTLAVFNPANALEPGWTGIFKAVVFSILAFQGFETAAPLAEEVKDPRRTIPRTIMYSAVACGAFYVLCSYASVIGWGFDDMANFATADSPWIDLAHKFWGPAWVLVLLALFNSFLGNINAGTIAASRIVFAFGRMGRLPARFGSTHPTHATPTFAIYFQTGVSIIVALGLGLILGPVTTFSVLGALITVFAIIIYIMTCLACIKYHLTDRAERGTNIVLHVVFPGLAIAILLAPLYFQFIPWPEYPGNLGNIAAIVVIGCAAAAALLANFRGEPASVLAAPDLSPIDITDEKG